MDEKICSRESSREFARSVLNNLMHLGVRSFVVSPGSRNAPISYELGAAERKGWVHAYVRIDERDAGFTALGLAKVSGVPSVVVTTSGTAVANVFPAVLEARHSGVPLLVLTADRPPELQGTGANQTTRQTGIFGDKAVASFSLNAVGDVRDETMKRYIEEIYDTMMRAPRGAVHLNIHFGEPLVPLDG